MAFGVFRMVMIELALGSVLLSRCLAALSFFGLGLLFGLSGVLIEGSHAVINQLIPCEHLEGAFRMLHYFESALFLLCSILV